MQNKKILEKKLRKIEAEPLGDDDIKKILPHVPIIKYSEFNKYNSIDDCLPNENSMLVYLIEDSPNNGHWCCLTKRNNEILNFDPYGNQIDADLKWTDMQTRRMLGEGESLLSKLLHKSDKTVKYNNVNYQNKTKNDINTCGRHCVMFLCSNLGLEDYYNLMQKLKKQMKLDYDGVVSVFTKKL
jgi:hypothetical protein